MNIVEIMRALSTAEQTYGEVSKEVDTIVRDMDLFGSDLRTAIHHTTSITPSPLLQDLLQNLLTVIDSGGNIPVYFRDKSEQYLEKAEDDQKGYLETLALIAESYVTAFVAGPLFAIIMGVMMVLMGSGNDAMLYAVIYGLIPIGSVMFVVMINLLSPAGSGKPPILSTTTPLTHDVSMPSELEKISIDDESIDLSDIKVEKRRFGGLIKSRKSLTIKQVFKNPLKPIKQTPTLGFAITIPIALIFVGVAMLTHQTDILIDGLISTIDDYLIFGMYIAVLPIAIFHEIKSFREKKLQTQIPDFLKKLASTNETGMTLRDSIYLMAKTDNSSLAPELKKIRNDIEWGLSINDGLIRFANRIRTSLVSRSITLITKANESSGDVGDVLLVAARDAAKERKMAKERFVNMMIYIVIILMSFMVFLVVVYVISASFLTEMAKAGEQMAASG
ncbi:MAG: type II secretion system F family protein, partial [Methanosarcinales archaeon]|nr:type II secretion system F family protein [Methanosarcinales archaeon]